MQDTILRQDIIDELEFEPSIDAADIGVAVEDGVVTLTGHVPTYSQKVTVERIVRRVNGVHGIAEEIEVRPRGANLTADDEIAKCAVSMLKWNVSVPAEDIQVSVHKGWVTLTGTVEWQYQKKAAAETLHGLVGLKGIANNIDVKPSVLAPDVKKSIEEAFRRDAELEADAIEVDVDDGRVVLQGRIKAWREREAAERAAWSVPGVREVDDRLSFS